MHTPIETHSTDSPKSTEYISPQLQLIQIHIVSSILSFNLFKTVTRMYIIIRANITSLLTNFLQPIFFLHTNSKAASRPPPGR